jgi:hypothetical protein
VWDERATLKWGIDPGLISMMTQISTVSRIRTLLCVVALVALVLAPGIAFGLRINGPGDAALAGALVQDFDSEAADTYFTNQTFSIGPDGFSVIPVGAELHIDDQFCATFGTSGNCLDTMNNGGQGNDDFDVVFTGIGVTAFGFALNALDLDWTVQTLDASNNLLGTYVISSQSPGLTGFARQGYFGATEASRIQRFTVRSAGNDPALIDDFSYVVNPVPEPNVAILLGLGLLTLAGTRIRDLQPSPPIRTDRE